MRNYFILCVASPSLSSKVVNCIELPNVYDFLRFPFSKVLPTRLVIVK